MLVQGIKVKFWLADANAQQLIEWLVFKLQISSKLAYNLLEVPSYEGRNQENLWFDSYRALKMKTGTKSTNILSMR